MPRKTVTMLTDDFDGKELPEETQPVRLSLGRTTYNLYLSEQNHGKLMDALTPFIENAETSKTTAPSGASSKAAGDKEKMKAVREWAQATGFKYKTATGEERTLGDKGRIPAEVVDAYDAAN